MRLPRNAPMSAGLVAVAALLATVPAHGGEIGPDADWTALTVSVNGA